MFKDLTTKNNKENKTVNLPEKLTIKGRNINLKTVTKDFDAEFSRIFFTIETSAENILTLNLKADTEAIINSLPERFPIDKLNLSTKLTLNGRIDSSLNWANIDISTKNFKSDILSIKRIKWNLKYDSTGLITLTKTGDNIPADIIFEAETKENNYRLKINTQDLVFNEHFSISNLPPAYSFIKESSISGSASIILNDQEEAIEYEGELDISDIKTVLDKPFRISTAFSGINNEIKISNLSLKSESGRAYFEGNIGIKKNPVINGTLSVPGFSFKGFEIRTSIDIETDKRGKYYIVSDSAYLNGLMTSPIKAEISPYKDNIEFSIHTDILPPGREPEHIFSEGIIQLEDDYYIQAVLDAEKLLIEPVLNAISNNLTLPVILGELELSSKIFISGTIQQLSFASPQISIIDNNNPNHFLKFSLSGNNSGIRISDINLAWDKNLLSGKISSDLSKEGDLILKTNILLNNTNLNLSGVFDNKKNLSLSGEYGITLNWMNMPLKSGSRLLLNIDRLPLNQADGKTSFLSINANGIINSSKKWKLLLNKFLIEDIPTGYGKGTAGFSALLSDKGGSIYNLSYGDKNTKLTGWGNLLLNNFHPLPDGRLQLEMYSETDRERYSLILGLDENMLDGEMKFTGLPLSRLTDEVFLKGDLNGKISFGGTTKSPKLGFILNTGNSFLNNEKLTFKTSIYYEDLKLGIDELSAEYGLYRFNDTKGLFDIKKGRHSFSTKITSDSALMGLTTDISAQAETEPIKNPLNISDIFNQDLNVKIKADNTEFNQEKKSPWVIDIVKDDQKLVFTGGKQDEIRGEMLENGEFSLSFQKPFPATFSASGIITGGRIEASIENIKYTFDNLALLNMNFYAGELRGNLRLHGPLNDPDFFGQIDFRDMEFQPPVVRDITKSFDTSFFFSGKEVTVPATKAETNNGIVFLNLTASLERWLPKTYDINLSVPEGQAISAEIKNKSIYLYGFAEGVMRIYGDFTTMHIDGDINASEAVFMLRNDDNFQNKNSIEFITSDMRVTFGENNQFFWPSQDFPIVNGFLSGSSELFLQYDNSASGMVINGNLDLNGGELFYFERNFYIKKGQINFINDTAPSINPRFSTLAEIRDINSEGEMTKIYLIVDDSPLKSFTPRFESEPSMPTSEIIAILSGNIFDKFESGYDSVKNAFLLGTDLFTQFAIIKRLEDNIKNSLGLDLLSIRTSIISNIFESFTSDNTNYDSLSKYLDNTTLFLGKYFTDDIFIQGMFQFDLYNDKGYYKNPEINFDSEIALEWEGPVANVELSFFPDFLDPAEGLRKTSVGLSWHFSY